MSGVTWAELVRDRFASGRSSRPEDPVPWHLDDKAAAYGWARDRGFRTPSLANAPTLRKALKHRLARNGDFVLKQPNSHSGRGTYVLTRLDKRTYFEHLRLEAIALDSLEALDETARHWLIEERIDGGVEGAHIPYDYKIYCFHGQPMMVFQIDRAVTPPRVAIFDGAFIPMEPTVHYRVDPARGGYGSHVLPRFAEAMLRMAQDMARQLATQFVRIDLFDSPSGPVFGEFTFAPGGVHSGMITLTNEVHDHLDDVLRNQATPRCLSGFDVDLSAVHDSALSTPTLIDDSLNLRRVRQGASRGDRRYAHRTLRHLNRRSRLRVLFEHSLRVTAVANGDNKYAAHIALALESPAFPFTGKKGSEPYLAIGLNHHGRRQQETEWDMYRYAQLTALQDLDAGKAIMRQLAERGSTRANASLSAEAPRDPARTDDKSV